MDGLLIYIFFGLIFIAILFDFASRSIPNILNLLILFLAIYIRRDDLGSVFVGAAVYSLPLVLIYGYVSDLFAKDVLGFGDIKLCFSLGALLYTAGESLFLQIYIYYLLVFIPAGILSIFILIYNFTRAKKENKGIAFSFFLCLAFVLQYYFYKYILGEFLHYVDRIL